MTTSGSAAVLDRPRSPHRSESAPVSEPTAAAEHGATSSRGWRARVPLLAVTAVALVVNCWSLSIQGLGNQYYAAATRSMTMSWSNFFFVSFDPGGFISVDKPPVFLWVAALSARVFGVNSWSLLLPSALAGAGAVALLYCTVARRFGAIAGTIAGLVLALSPINVAVNRLNLPEPFMILFLVAAAWAVLQSLEAKRGLRWVVLAAVFMGLAFNTKMLAAFIPLPAIGLALLVGTRGWLEKAKRAAVFGVTTVLVSLAWIVAVDLTPASSRPYVGGSIDNTVRDLVFGYNGFGRISGGAGMGGGRPPGGGAGPVGGSMGTAGGIFGGTAGPARLLSEALGGQIAWLLPLVVLALVASIWFFRRDRERRSAIVLWAGWLALYGVVFSYAGGTFHAYYTSAMGPAIAALLGIGAAAMLPLLRRHTRWFLALGTGVLATVGLQLVLAGRVPGFYEWVRPLIAMGLAASITGLVLGYARRKGRAVVLALAMGLAALLVLPAAWAVSETTNPVLNATLPQAGPRQGAAGSSFGSASSNGDTALARYLHDHNTGETWDLVVANAQVGSGYIAYDDLSVLALGGFMGSDNTTNVSQIADLVASGQVRFFQVSSVSGARSGGPGGATGGGMTGGGMTGGSSSRVLSAVQQSCTAVRASSSADSLPARYDGTVYDCSGRADALRAVSSSTVGR